ncbi:hypothetical protein ANCCEY_11389 [Ancylostoma ceylanicum]|uniref:Reverse transcriptase domain-containing protein n=1 Tax=Ancylostoma ceylanicum TaxID=53326 RepID=A0A0D6LCC3_9BILA|nr:hypothetical protein ANCCEY_11389 [Ancylostoma ceylanicum]
MLRRLDEKGSKAGLTINTTKTKVMRSAFSSPQPVLLQGVPLEAVSEYVYLARLLNMENGIKPEIERIGRAGWAAFNQKRTRSCHEAFSVTSRTATLTARTPESDGVDKFRILLVSEYEDPFYLRTMALQLEHLEAEFILPL